LEFVISAGCPSLTYSQFAINILMFSLSISREMEETRFIENKKQNIYET
jgi:hypothetical protein